MNPYKEIFLSLVENKIKFLIVGGVAINLHGVDRFTGDIDILLALDEKNLKRMEKTMEKLGYIQRLPVKLHELNNRKKVETWLRTKGMTAYTFLSEDKLNLDIDIIAAKSLDFDKYYKKRLDLRVWDIVLPVVSMEDLIDMKKEAGRNRDLLDLEELLKLKGEED